MDEVLSCFLDEAHEHLTAFTDAVLRLEQDPDVTGPVDDMFRAMHTIKGAAGFLALGGTEELAHSAEDVLGRVRARDLRLTPTLASLLLAASDELAAHLRDIAVHGAEDGRDSSDLLVRLRAASTGDQLADDDEAHPTAPAVSESPTAGEGPPGAPEPSGAGDDASVRTLRVAAGTLDGLLAGVGELVNVRNGLSRLAAERDDLALTRCAGELEQVAAGLRDAVRRARTQPVGAAWQALPRAARDTALRAGKQVRLVMRGGDLECDRDVLDAVREPLLHLVRNAVDHGIEDAPARSRAGKPVEGTLRLTAVRTGAHLLLELSDDGAGIDVRSVAARALATGVVTQAELDRMAAHDVVRLVLRAGVSTSEQITAVSGRGVGMDVVHRAVQDVGGRLDLVSEPGRGTTVTVRLPVSLGIAQVLTVDVRDRRYAIPVDQVADLVRVEPDERELVVARAVGGHVVRWRGLTVPLVDLRDLAGDARDAAGDRTASDVWHVAVVRAGAGLVALQADAFGDTEEVVVRPLDAALDGVVPCAGSAVLGDGSPVLLLDGSAVAAACGRVPVLAEPDLVVGSERGRARDAAGDDVLLLVDAGGGRRLGLPLADVARVLEVPTDALEPVGSWHIAHVDGEILPVVPALHSLATAGVGASTQVVVVRTLDGREVGIAVAAVEDLAPATASADLAEDGLDGVVVVAGRLAGQLDVRQAVADALAASPLGDVA